MSMNSLAEHWAPGRARLSLASLGARLRGAWRAEWARIRQRQAERQLAMLDDRLLRDIGLDRGAIHWSVMHGRDR